MPKITLADKKEKVQTMIKSASALELELVWIPKIVAKQTLTEICHESTEEENGVGLTGVDAGFVTSIYKRITSGSHLTPKMVDAIKKILPKYHRQYASMMSF